MKILKKTLELTLVRVDLEDDLIRLFIGSDRSDTKFQIGGLMGDAFTCHYTTQMFKKKGSLCTELDDSQLLCLIASCKKEYKAFMGGMKKALSSGPICTSCNCKITQYLGENVEDFVCQSCRTDGKPFLPKYNGKREFVNISTWVCEYCEDWTEQTIKKTMYDNGTEERISTCNRCNKEIA